MKKSTQRLALCGILTGMSVVVMALSYLIPGLTYGLPMLAGGLLIIPVAEYGLKPALTMYTAVSLTAMIIAAEKEAALMYVFLFGLYPILYRLFGMIGKKPLRIFVKFIYFNIAAVSAQALAAFVFGIPIEQGWWMLAGLLVVFNVMFFVYDLALGRFYIVYDIRFRPLVARFFKRY